MSANAKNRICAAYNNVGILEPFRKGAEHSLLMLLFNDTGSGGKYSKGTFSLPCILRLAGHKKYLQKFWPILT